MGLHGFNGFCGVSVLPPSSWPLSPRQMGDKLSLAGLAQQEGMAGVGRGVTTQASLGGAAAGKPLGACCKQPVNLGDLQEAGSLPTEGWPPHSGLAGEEPRRQRPGACARAHPRAGPAGCLPRVGWAST